MREKGERAPERVSTIYRGATGASALPIQAKFRGEGSDDRKSPSGQDKRVYPLRSTMGGLSVAINGFDPEACDKSAVLLDPMYGSRAAVRSDSERNGAGLQ